MRKTNDDKWIKELEKHRRTVDKLDRQLIQLLARRFRVVAKIGVVKTKMSAPIVQKKRWSQMTKDRKAWAGHLDVSPNLVKRIFSLIQEEAIRLQNKK